MLHGIARLAIAAPRRIIAVGAAGLWSLPLCSASRSSKQPVRGRLPRPDLSSRHKRQQMLSQTFGQGDMQLVISVTSEAGAQSPPRGRAGSDIVRQLQNSPFVAEVDLGVDVAAVGRSRVDQQGRQDRA